MHVDVYHPPADHALEPYLSAIFRMRAAFQHETILPKGVLDIHFNLGDDFNVTGARYRNERSRNARTAVVGVQTHALAARPVGTVDLLGICLRAEGCAALLPLPASELTDRCVDGDVVYPELTQVAERLHGAQSFAVQRTLLVEWLTTRLRARPLTATVLHACALLRGQPNDENVRATARALSLSARHLQRVFAEHVGVSPSEYVRLARFVGALQATRQAGVTLTRIAHTERYHDQAHLSREFRHFAGMTPLAYRRQSTGPVAGHIFTP